MDAIQERLAKIREKTEVIYTLETLEYLARGGRIGRVKALAGALLNLKPIIRVDYGRQVQHRDHRAHNGKSMRRPDHLHDMFTNTPLWVTVLHGRFAEKADALAKESWNNSTLPNWK